MSYGPMRAETLVSPPAATTRVPYRNPCEGDKLSEELLLRTGSAYEAATEWHRVLQPGMGASTPESAAALNAA